MFQVGEEQYRKLDIFHIYFDSATYDMIERDVKNSLEDQLGVLGGTLGLFTGFSILSGVEIAFYLGKMFLVHSRIGKTCCSVMQDWFSNHL